LIHADDVSHLWVASQASMEQELAFFYANSAANTRTVAFDTEFVRTNTFYAQPGIIQLCFDNCAARRILLIDPLVINNWNPVNQLFSNTDVTKVVHACGEDLEFFSSLGISQPTPLFDTQIASAFLGGALNEGLQKLVERYLGFHLAKHETRSDWSQRPLTDEQLQYAKEDVLYLLPLWQEMMTALAAQGKTEWVLNEGELLVNQSKQPVAEDKYYLKIRGGWKLKPEVQYILARLAELRESLAKQINRPRGYICTDSDLLLMAQHQPRTLSWLSTQSNMQAAALRRFGRAFLQLIETCLPVGEANIPADFTLIQPPLPKASKTIYRQLKNRVQQVALDSSIQPTLLASRSMLEGLLFWNLNNRQGPLPQLMKSWRKHCVGDVLNAMIEEHFLSQDLNKE